MFGAGSHCLVLCEGERLRARPQGALFSKGLDARGWMLGAVCSGLLHTGSASVSWRRAAVPGGCSMLQKRFCWLLACFVFPCNGSQSKMSCCSKKTHLPRAGWMGDFWLEQPRGLCGCLLPGCDGHGHAGRVCLERAARVAGTRGDIWGCRAAAGCRGASLQWQSLRIALGLCCLNHSESVQAAQTWLRVVCERCCRDGSGAHQRGFHAALQPTPVCGCLDAR